MSFQDQIPANRRMIHLDDKDFAIKPPEGRKMIYVEDTTSISSNGVDYLAELIRDAEYCDITFSKERLGELGAGLATIIPHEHSGCVYPHSVYAAYHLFYKAGKIIALPETVIDRLLFEWCNHSMFAALFKEALNQNVLDIVHYRVGVAAYCGQIKRDVLSLLEATIGVHPPAYYQATLETLSRDSSVDDVILGRIGYFAFVKWYADYSNEGFFWKDGRVKNLLESR